MIRCNKCGFPGNRDDAKRCIKCNTPLTAEPVKAAGGGDTLRDVFLEREPLDKPVEKPKPAEKQPPPPAPSDHNITVLRPLGAREKTCSLVALTPDMQQELRTLPFSGSSVLLKRDTLEAGNTSLSREGQANLVNRNGEWWIEDLSTLKSTFVQVTRPVKLSDGDIIQMGDSLYRFKANP